MTSNNQTENHWQNSTLGEIADWASGGTPSSGVMDYYVGDIPWAIIGDLNDGLVSTTAKHITTAGLENSSAKIAEPGALLVAMYGSIGKLGIADVKLAMNQAIAFTQKIYGGIPVKYIYYYLLFSRPALNRLGKGGAQLNISQSILKDFPIPLPSLDLQKRIVSKLDHLFEKCKKVNGRLAIVSQKIDQFETLKTNDLLTGVGIDFKIADEHAENNFLEIHNTLFEERTNLIDITTLPALPANWIWVRLKDVADIQGGVTKGRNFKDAPTIELPYLRVANVQDGYLDLKEIKRIPIKRSEKQRFLLRTGDVLLTEGGDRDKLGRGTVWNEEIKECTYQNHIFRARINSTFAKPEFISIITKSEFSKKYFYDNANQTVNLASINITVLGNLPIPLPPIKYQEYIIASYQKLRKNSASLKQKLTTIEQRMETLQYATLEKIFKDRRVDIMNDDEPIETLFLRIASEREQTLVRRSATSKQPRSNKTKKTLMARPTKTLEDMVACLTKLGGEAYPDALLIAASLEDEVDLFFELLRKGRDESILQVPIGENGTISII